jgi:hypothetical protein
MTVGVPTLADHLKLRIRALGEFYGCRRFHVLLLCTKQGLLQRVACLAEFNRYVPYLAAVILTK